MKDTLLVHQHFKCSRRCCDQFYNLVDSYDPPFRNHHNKVLYCLIDGDHIYTLNHDIKRLEQMHGVTDKHIVKPSSDFYVSDKDEAPIYYKMIDTIDDIMAILKYKESENKNKDKDEKTKK